MKKTFFLLSFILLLFSSKTSLCQETPDTPITHFYKEPPVYKMSLMHGRVIGVNLEDVSGAAIMNKRTAEKATTNSRGIYELNAAKGDTLIFEFSKYSKTLRSVKYPKEQLNVIMIKRTADALPANRSSSEYNKASRADDELLRVLEKDAKLEDKWNY